MMPAADREVLRDLARRIAEIAALPVQREKAELWYQLNSLRRVRPMVCIQNGTWHENRDVIVCRCADEWARGQEWGLRAQLYHWEHMRDDCVWTDVIRTPLYLDWGDPGIRGSVTRPEHEFGAAHYNSVLDDDADPRMMKMPVVSLEPEKTEQEYQKYADLYGGILRVQKGSVYYHWFAPMDQFITWRGLDKTFLDMIDRPAYVHAWMDRLTEYQLVQLDQLEALGALGLNNGANWVGPGGMGFTHDLPQKDFDGVHVRAIDQWSHAAAQIFAEVSPAMHEEFALRYESRYLARFGLASYGCCEPLHRKVHVIRRNIPNLRRLSMSPWVDTAVGAAAIGRDFIFSYKPNPALLGMEHWDIGPAREQLRTALENTRGCVVEVILKDLHTVRKQPERMWQWVDMAMKMAQEFA